jgi:hypothetical protein
VVVSVLYLLFRRALAVAALRFRWAEFKELEIVVPWPRAWGSSAEGRQ